MTLDAISSGVPILPMGCSAFKLGGTLSPTNPVWIVPGQIAFTLIAFF